MYGLAGKLRAQQCKLLVLGPGVTCIKPQPALGALEVNKRLAGAHVHVVCHIVVVFDGDLHQRL